ncbi:MAG: alpha/beta fold hydrolase [Candidatus Nanopelagicales bacterium]
MSYATQSAWREIQAHLPLQYQLAPGEEPAEEWWPWRGHEVHLDCYRDAQAPAKVILFHGVGTNGRQLSTILGAPLHRRGFETIAIDLPEYGVTRVARGARVRYDDWVQAGVDLVAVERARDDRPIIAYGLSAGGMLAYQVAAATGQVAGVVGMCFLDQSVAQVADETALNVAMSRVGAPLVRFAARTPLSGLRMPMRVASKMHKLVNDPATLAACLRDGTSAGNAMTMTFLASYLAYRPTVEPEQFDVCPILLTQPGEDRWTPLHLSLLFLDRIDRVPVLTVTLDGAGHYPIEQRGLDQLVDAVEAFTRAQVAAAR